MKNIIIPILMLGATVIVAQENYIYGDAVVDNLIADEKATPMIIVMPNGRALPFIVNCNSSLTNLSAGALTNVSGIVSVSSNTAAGVIDLNSLVTSTGSLSIDDNSSAGVIRRRPRSPNRK